MNLLPNELILEIFNHIQKITDKRQFLKTCNYYNNLTKQLVLNFESYYFINYFGHKYNYKNEYCIEKFTLEICCDEYFDMLPKSYINKNNKIILVALATFNCVKLLELALDNGCSAYSSWGEKCDNDADSICEFAALNGHIEILKWAISKFNKRILYDSIACSGAALGGHLETLKWLREHGFQWDMYACSFAVICGQLEILQWIMANGGEWDNDAYRCAENYGHKEVLKWIIDKGYPH